MSQIFIFGDSITWGSWDPEGGGWVDRLKREIMKYVEQSPEDRWIVVYNLGVPSNRTDQLLQRFKFEVDQRYDEDEAEKYFIFAFGANDAAFKVNEGKFRVDIDEYKVNIKRVITLAREYSNNMAFLNTTPVDEAKTDAVVDENKSRKNEYVDRYNHELAVICGEEKVDYIDINSAFKKGGTATLLSEDGLHPSSAGHRVILEIVKDYLKSKGQIG